MDKLKKDLQEAVKSQVSAPKTPTPRKIFGINRPSTALAQKNGLEKNGSATEQATKRNINTTPMSARGAKKEDSNLNTPIKGRDQTKSTMGTTSGLKRPTTAAVTTKLASAVSFRKSIAKTSNGDTTS